MIILCLLQSKVKKSTTPIKIENKPFKETKFNSNEIYWRYVPDKVVYNYITDEQKAKVKSLIKAKKAYSSMRYKFDLKGNLKRFAFVNIHEHNHVKKFKTYYQI